MPIVYEDFHKFSENFETCLKTILTAAGIVEEQVNKQRGRATLPNTRVDVQFSQGGEAGHYSRNHLNEYVADAWNANVRFQIFADRSKAPAYIEATKQKIRAAFAAWRLQFTGDRLPYYTVRSFKEAGTTPTVQADRDRDVATMVFAVFYTQRLWWNSEQEHTAECGNGETGEPVTKTVAALTYYAESKAAADALALEQATTEAEAELVCVLPGLFAALPLGSQINSTTWNTIASAAESFVFSALTDKNATIRIRGIAESKAYTGGAVVSGWQVGGAPANTTYNVYKLEISSPAQTYFLNAEAVQAGGTDARIWDFLKTVRINAGATVTLTADSVDSKELGTSNKTVPEYVGLPLPVVQPYQGQFFSVQITSLADV